jgi:hypothetical protein
MIRSGFKVMVFNPKVVANGKKFVFQTGTKGKDNVTRYVSMMTNYDDTLENIQHKEFVMLENINGADVGEYNGKAQLTLFVEIKPMSESAIEYEDVTNPIQIDESDLPF